MPLINVPDIQNLDAATPELWNSRFGTITNVINGNLSSANLADSAVTAPKLATDSVTTGKIVDANVTPAKRTEPYKFSVHRAAAHTSSNSFTLVQFDTKLYDTSSNVDVVTNKGRFTAPVSGFYHFSALVGNPSNGGVPIHTKLYKNGSSIKVGSYPGAAPSGAAFSGVSGDLQLIAGDYVEVYFLGVNGAAMTTGSDACYFDGHLISIT